MEACKAQIDPVEFGTVKGTLVGVLKKVDEVAEGQKVTEKKVDSLKWYILLGLVGSTTLAPEAKNAIIALVEHLISVTYAAL
jgi:hypothetical protein